MPTTAKALASARELADLLKLQLAATMPVVTETFDSDGNPVVTFSADATPATGEKVVVLRVKPIAWPEAKDSLNLTALQYSGHAYQICTEKNFEGATDNVLDILGPAELLPVIAECSKRGSFVEWFRSANGTVPAVGQMTAANLAAQWKNQLYWGVLSAQ